MRTQTRTLIIAAVVAFSPAAFPQETKPATNAPARRGDRSPPITVALNHHDKFNWIGAFSSAPPPTNSIVGALDAPEAVNRDLKLFWLACGKKDFLFKGNGDFDALLKSKSIRHEYLETEGDHSWPVWRRHLVEFAPKLFR